MVRKLELPPAVTREAFPHDPDFPQLAVATDPAEMLERFRAHLRPATGNACHIEACTPFRFRCRQSTSRCVLQYTLQVVDPVANRRWEQWVTGLLYAEPGAAERVWHEMQDGDPCRDIPERWHTFEPVTFIPELQMAVQVFPYDRKLPNLARVLNGAWHGLERLIDCREPVSWHVDQRALEPMRYRTELGAALKYTVWTRDTLTAGVATRRCYLKVYRNEHGAETYRLLRALCDRGGVEQKAYRVVRPLTYVGELRTLALEEAPGVALQHALALGDFATAIPAVARAVAAFNQDGPPVAQRHTLADQLDDVRRAASLVQWACPRTRAEVLAITAAVVHGLRERSPAPIHRDLKTDHVFLSGDRVFFIDLDSVALGDPVRDPAHLVAHILGRVGLDSLSDDQARAAATRFVEEYFAHVPPSWREQFDLHCAGALLEVAGGIFKRQECAWPSKVAALVAEARRVLDGGGV